MASPDGSKPPPVAADPENPVSDAAPSGDAAVTSVVRRWRREDLNDKAGMVLRGLGTLFSLLAFVVMASNKHGEWREFDQYEEYRYLVAISVLAFLYSGVQLALQVHRFSSGKELLSRRTSVMVDFAGDQLKDFRFVVRGWITLRAHLGEFLKISKEEQHATSKIGLLGSALVSGFWHPLCISSLHLLSLSLPLGSN